MQGNAKRAYIPSASGSTINKWNVRTASDQQPPSEPFTRVDPIDSDLNIPSLGGRGFGKREKVSREVRVPQAQPIIYNLPVSSSSPLSSLHSPQPRIYKQPVPSFSHSSSLHPPRASVRWSSEFTSSGSHGLPGTISSPDVPTAFVQVRSMTVFVSRWR